MKHKISEEARDLIIEINIDALIIVVFVLATFLVFTTFSEKQQKKKDLYEIKTAPIIYVDGQKGDYNYCLVYVDGVGTIAIDILNEIIYTSIEQGDTAVYVEQQSTSDLTLINVKKGV